MLRVENVKLHQQDGLFDIYVKDGIIETITAAESDRQSVQKVIDGNGCLALPPFVDPHVHLDTALTAGEPVWNRSGTLFEGIQNWSERKKTLTHDDVRERAATAIEWYVAQGFSTCVVT